MPVPGPSRHRGHLVAVAQVDYHPLMALRFDITKLDDPRRDHNGYLVADAHATRTGVFIYHHPDGSTTRELRHPDDVFRPDSISTLKNRPLTDGHPVEGKVDSENTRRLAIGMAVDDPKQDGRFINTKLQVTDEDTINRILANDNPLREISCGYEADISAETGTFQGDEYDHRQKNIKYNHLALVRRGRAGSQVRLQLDSAVGDGLEEFIKTDIEVTEERIHVPVRGNEQFEEGSFRTTALKGVEGVSLVTAKLKNPPKGKEGSMVAQKFIFNKKQFTEEQAKTFVSKNRGDAIGELTVDFEETDKTIEIPVKGFNMFVPKSFRNVKIKGVDGVTIRVGLLKKPHSGKQGSDTPQSYSFDKDKFSVSEAKAFIANRGDAHNNLVKVKDINQTTNRDEHKPIRGDSDMIKIKRDAVNIRAFIMDAFEVQIEDNVDSGEKAVEMVIARLDSAIAHIRTLEGEKDHMQGKIDAMKDQGKVGLAKLNDLVKERTDAVNAAHYLGLKDFMDLETDDLKKSVVVKAYPQVKIDELTKDHIEGRYDTVIEGIKVEGTNLKSTLGLKTPESNNPRFPTHNDDLEPREKFLKDTKDMHMTKEQRELNS